jgi:2-(1,2-epoxy-1,2-dihydrophenyl)acetyl-CoA isomerase
MAFETIRYDVAGGIARITLDRPQAMNAINDVLAREFLLAAIEADTDPKVRAILLAGSGPMFCAGGDLKLFAGAGDRLAARVDRVTTDLHAAISRLLRCDAPVVVAVNGGAAGAGMSLAIAGDVVFAAESATFTMAYTAAGLTPDGSCTYVMPRLIGTRRTLELMLTNRSLTAAEARDWGLVSHVVPDADLIDRAEAQAATLAAGPTKAFGSIKALLLETYASGLETQMERESRYVAAAAQSRDGREGVAAFAAKRKPKFIGE